MREVRYCEVTHFRFFSEKPASAPACLPAKLPDFKTSKLRHPAIFSKSFLRIPRNIVILYGLVLYGPS